MLVIMILYLYFKFYVVAALLIVPYIMLLLNIWHPFIFDHSCRHGVKLHTSSKFIGRHKAREEESHILPAD